MNSSIVPSLLGLLSALLWGAGDFCGGLATRRVPVLGVLILAEFTGFVLLVLLGRAFEEIVPAAGAIGFAVAAGVSGSIGLGSLYHGLAIGRASIVAPVSAVIGAMLPALFTVYTAGLPGALQLVGFGFAFAAIVLASQSNQKGSAGNAISFAVLAGFGFGGFFIFMDQASGPASTFYPLAIARGCPIPILLLINFARKTALLPPRNAIWLVLLTGILDAAGTIFFLLSSTLGRLDVATILSSLFPASTVILSRLILAEPISSLQKIGVLLALAAIILIVW